MLGVAELRVALVGALSLTLDAYVHHDTGLPRLRASDDTFYATDFRLIHGLSFAL
jgi:hypothetical protein